KSRIASTVRLPGNFKYQICLSCCLRGSGWFALLLLFSIVLFSGEVVPAQSNDSDRASIALEALSRLKGLDLEANPAVKSAVLKVLEQVRGRPEFVEIVRDFKIKGQEKGLLEL